MQSLILLIDTILEIYVWLIIASVVMSWLIAFNVINLQNQFVRQVQYFLMRLTEPVLRPIRRMLPDMGGIDISPIIVLLAIMFARSLLYEYGTRLV